MENVKKTLSSSLAGLILGLIMVAAFLLSYYSGRAFEKGAVGYLPYLIVIGLLIYFIIRYSNDNDNDVTFGNCFAYGFKASAVMAIIVFAATLVFILTQPEYKEQFLTFMNAELDKDTKLTQEQRDTSINMMDKFFVISILGGGLFMNLLVGCIGSLIGAAVAKKHPKPNPF